MPCSSCSALHGVNPNYTKKEKKRLKDHVTCMQPIRIISAPTTSGVNSASVDEPLLM